MSWYDEVIKTWFSNRPRVAATWDDEAYTWNDTHATWDDVGKSATWQASNQRPWYTLR